MTSPRQQSSAAWHSQARAVMPGGVNSPVRAFGAVGSEPVYVDAAAGARLRTVEGAELIDFVASWGAHILGHAHPEVTAAVAEALARGTSYGMPTAAEVELAELVTTLMPAVEVVRLVNSGTEATASALRVARAATGRSRVVKFEGCYHGHSDSFLVKAGSGLATFGRPSSPGVPGSTAADTRVARFNDLEAVEGHLSDGDVAAVIVEPVAGNMGCIPPVDGFLAGLRRLCDDQGALLIFDEVMTGFRVALGGAQGLYGVTPDLTALGKVVAGGTPGAAYGGRADLMALVAPDGPVYQAGTLAGNPLVTAAGLATLRHLAAAPELYDRFDRATDAIAARLGEACRRAGVPSSVTRAGGMVGLFLGVENPTDWDSVAGLDTALFSRFFRAALERGVLLPPSPFESWFLMESHLDGDLDTALDVLAGAIAEAAA